MSWSAAEHPQCRGERNPPSVETVIQPKPKDIGAFEVRRCLPSADRRSIGPFVFFDEMGPAVLAPGAGMDVRPHPHINLATLTYLFDGEIHHRDSLGTSRTITPGAVNLMVAGRGIVHSERSPASARPVVAGLHGLQMWIALPAADEETEPAFHHYPTSDLPIWVDSGVQTRLLVGRVGGRQSPVRMFSETLYLVMQMPPNSEAELPDASERGLYVVSGAIELDGARFSAGTMVVLAGSAPVKVRAAEATRFALIGGSPLGERTLFWNFVSSRPQRIETAKADWAAGRFPTIPGDDQERIPLPE